MSRIHYAVDGLTCVRILQPFGEYQTGDIVLVHTSWARQWRNEGRAANAPLPSWTEIQKAHARAAGLED